MPIARQSSERAILSGNWLLLITLACGLSLASPSLPAHGQDSEAPEPKPTAVTIDNPQIPVEQLKLLLKPLTREELVVEAAAWRDLLRSKLQQISDQQIRVLAKQEAADQATDAAAEAEDANDTTAAEQVTEASEAADEEKQELAATLPQLQEEQANLADRLNVVVDALEKKGGDVESYRQYMAAVSGIALEGADAATAWTVLKGWFWSEQGGQRWMWNLIKFLMILGVFYFGSSIIAGLARHAVSRVRGASQLLINFVGSFIKQILMLIGFIVALAALEVNIAPLLAAVGAAGFVIGLALQDSLGNFASGMLILLYRPFDTGDVIEAAGVSGVVDSVSLVSTKIRTFDNKMMIVPNNDIWGGTITNATASDTRRVDMVFGIGYDDDAAQAKEILQRVVKAHPLVLDDPAPTIQLNELGDSSVNFICRPWSKTADYWTVYWDLTQTIKQEFDQHDISIPFPQRDVHVYHANAPAEPAEA